MNDYSKILVKVIFTLLENISALFLLFYFIWPDFVSFRFVSQNSISLICCIYIQIMALVVRCDYPVQEYKESDA